jgi:hypothetical protein
MASVLPDLPGTSDSLVPTHEISLANLAYAVEDLAAALIAEGRAPLTAAIRSGALLDVFADVPGRWHFAPQEGEDLQSGLRRIHAAASGKKLGLSWYYDEMSSPLMTLDIAGNRIRANLVAGLADQFTHDRTTPRDRVVRLDSDPREADRKVPGTPLWRRAEPDVDPTLAAVLAQDLADWVRTCVA